MSCDLPASILIRSAGFWLRFALRSDVMRKIIMSAQVRRIITH
jgi:hypothetical protein